MDEKLENQSGFCMTSHEKSPDLFLDFWFGRKFWSLEGLLRGEAGSSGPRKPGSWGGGGGSAQAWGARLSVSRKWGVGEDLLLFQPGQPARAGSGQASDPAKAGPAGPSETASASHSARPRQASRPASTAPRRHRREAQSVNKYSFCGPSLG